MSRPQLIVIAVALLLVVGIFFLPKVVINKDDKKADLTGATANRDKPAAADEEDHSGHDHAPGEHPTEEAVPHMAASPSQLKEIADLRSRFNKEQNADAKATLAAELGQKYRAISKFDSAGYFYETVANTRPTEQNFEKAGDLYFEAFSFAATEERGKVLGEKTQAMYNKVLEANPNNLDAKTNLAMTYIAGPNPMKGVTLLREVLEKDPNNEKAIYNMGYLSLQSRQFDKAVERFRRLVEINPKNVNGNFYLGVSLAETNQKAEAIKVFQNVKKLDKDPELQASVDEYLKKLQ
ncbi:tetratricopeptide repeat protein [Adhaeribacter soli]|uniref:Tetratricopeptide repeat protein n=1 Tax=Adhaeribacter soli TaxID=2607655 RepID=A0A5N1IPK7_9BACT|nr:tetratricopeptide repeat protein [Adhaeribacter soli]KAA9325410.1 tetratricopeptide repeat protein [Adhaeribacter soli]